MTALIDLLRAARPRPVAPDEHDCGAPGCVLRGLRAAEVRVLAPLVAALGLERSPLGCAQPPTREDDERAELLARQAVNAARCGCGGLCDSGRPCPMPRDDVDAFLAHLDRCKRCEELPFGLCAAGAVLLEAAGRAADATWGAAGHPDRFPPDFPAECKEDRKMPIQDNAEITKALEAAVEADFGERVKIIDGILSGDQAFGLDALTPEPGAPADFVAALGEVKDIWSKRLMPAFRSVAD